MEIDEKGSGDDEAEGDKKRDAGRTADTREVSSNRTIQDTAIQESPGGQDQRVGGPKQTSAV